MLEDYPGFRFPGQPSPLCQRAQMTSVT